jgi:tRNA G26 N,N-dimethylase Trm1
MSIDPQLYHMLQCYYALSIEVKTGLRHSRGSVLNLVRSEYGVEARTKVKAMAEMREKIEAKGHVFTEHDPMYQA